MDAIQRFRMRNGLAGIKTAEATNTPSVSVKDRQNYVTLANAVELITLISIGVLDDAKGLSKHIGNDKIMQRDIADATASKIMASVELLEGTE